jgi:hypothetical protein
LIGVCALEPVVILLDSGAGRENLVPCEETFEAILGVDRKEEYEDVLDIVGRGDDDLLVADDVMSGRCNDGVLAPEAAGDGGKLVFVEVVALDFVPNQS